MIITSDQAAHIRKILRLHLECLTKRLKNIGDIHERKQVKREVDDTLKALSFL